MEILFNSDKFYVGDVEKPHAFIGYRQEGNIWYWEHTQVDPSLQGQGVAGQLAKRFVEEAEKSKVKIVAHCPYGIGYFKRKPQYQHLLKDH
ncbi:MAG: N-acetyltransferase [Eubacteriaceae bacterium]|jgi:predicted GNAT family acetyltransferase|nr:N-acetyltransferase [Eubacteriaceae bacterium]